MSTIVISQDNNHNIADAKTYADPRQAFLAIMIDKPNTCVIDLMFKDRDLNAIRLAKLVRFWGELLNYEINIVQLNGVVKYEEFDYKHQQGNSPINLDVKENTKTFIKSVHNNDLNRDDILILTNITEFVKEHMKSDDNSSMYGCVGEMHNLSKEGVRKRIKSIQKKTNLEKLEPREFIERLIQQMVDGAIK